MAQIRVDSDILLAAVNTTNASIDRVRTENASLTTNLINLQSTWTGSASASFQDLLSQWRAVQLQVEEQLAQMNIALATAGNTYGSTESDVTRMFAGGAR
ncbi:hypothetical protein GCM10011490_11580 [Pseudoclavibacter endophyticus]|uniref:ESAT-6-like protein n=1 Tax=Pseudoclavibacter endophyticus TaxID=1778590 RepID=A0A6H9WES2_9MICO|nr:WXG100 family type VII secretion target [Pseudoclavibacter endophyticus]KAB1649419.1 WXG100 family type VII secretion target [Pseudoclavibacter endophyticus]GGA62794.1 hypothetical protein GCM10011490_11580 [Pseudoclavibacter endophyticus]